ncbi:MAG: LysM peptidoglycan-binding domain-containing protein, partial [Chloroflexota bacterium]|nr:LysM peptidoglycan-binding domain-containing protein [Chloroflexota bacterium]
MQRTNRTPGLTVLDARRFVAYQYELSHLAASVAILLAGLARARPRYLLHGAAALIGFGSVVGLVSQPRPAVAPAVPPAVEAAVADASPPLLAVTVAEFEPPAAVQAPPPAAAAPSPKPTPPKPFTHTVEEGETIRMLAARYSLSPATILSANDLPDPDLIEVGQELIILPSDGVLHTVRAGQSIRRLAELYGVDVADIVSANDLGGDPDLVQPGLQLVVPGAEPPRPRAAQGAVAQAGDGELQVASIGGGASLPIPTQRVVPSTRTYEVQAGDTLRSIAAKFGVDVETVMSSNGIGNGDSIK